MKAISLWQPWATLWACGAKKIETRSWPLRGALPQTLAVHAAKRPVDFVGMELLMKHCFSPLESILLTSKTKGLPLGKVVGVVTVSRVYQFIDAADEPAAPEKDFGDYTPGRFGWVTTDRFLLPEPVPCRGAQGLFNLPPDVAGMLSAQMQCEPAAAT